MIGEKMNKIARIAAVGVFGTALLAGGSVNAFAQDPVSWESIVANCPQLKDNPQAAEIQSEVEYYNAGVLPELPKEVQGCVVKVPAAELPDGDKYDVNEDGYLDYAEYIYNRLEDAANEAKAEADYLDAAEREYNRLLNEGDVANSTDQGNEAKPEQKKAEQKKAESKKVKALPTTGVAGGISGLGAVAAFAGAAAVAIRRYMK